MAIIDRLFRRRTRPSPEVWSTLPITDHRGRIYYYDKETDKVKPVRTSKRFKVLKTSFVPKYDTMSEYYTIGLDYTGNLLVYDARKLAENGVHSTEEEVLKFLESGRSILDGMKIVDIGPKGHGGRLFWAIDEDGKISAFRISPEDTKHTMGIGSLLPDGEIAIDSTGYDMILTKSGKVYTWFGDLIPSPPGVKFVKIIKGNPIILLTRDGEMYIGEKIRTREFELDEDAKYWFSGKLIGPHIDIPERIVSVHSTERFLPVRSSEPEYSGISRFLAKSGKVFRVKYGGKLEEIEQIGDGVKQLAFRQSFYDKVGRKDVVFLRKDGTMYEYRMKNNHKVVLIAKEVSKVFDRCLYYQHFDGSLRLFSSDFDYGQI